MRETLIFVVATRAGAGAAVSVPPVVGTAVRFGLLRIPPDRGVLWSFGVTSAAGGLAGALFQGWARHPWLTAVFGALLSFTGVSELLGWSERMH